MKKILITEEEKSRILKMYGLISEQSISFSVSGSYTASNCDELHAFQGTGGKVIGNMNVIVADKIKELNSKNISVEPLNVVVDVNDMTVNWSVSFTESNKNWVGFTSRGAGCNNDIEGRAGNDAINNGPKSIIEALKKKGKTVGEIEVINSYKYNGGDNSFKQVFYKYTLVEPEPQTKKKQYVIEGSTLDDLRVKMKSQKNIMVDETSFNVDFKNKKITFNEGNTLVDSMSFIWDDSKMLESRLDDIKIKNSNMVVPVKGTYSEFEWAVLLFTK